MKEAVLIGTGSAFEPFSPLFCLSLDVTWVSLLGVWHWVPAAAGMSRSTLAV